MKPKRHTNGSPGKAYSDGFAAGYAKGRDERAAEVAQIKAALDKALAENLAMRGKPNHMGA
jgi:hypothetical protein